MRKLLDILGNGLGVLLLVGLVVILIFSLNGIRQGENISNTFDSPVSTPLPETEPTPIPLPDDKLAEAVFESPLLPTETPTSTPVEPEPTATLTPVAELPPLCKFDGTGEEKKEVPSLIDQYVFSEPRPALDYEVSLDILGWLPGDQRLLIARPTKDEHRIEVFNIQSGKTKEYMKGFYLDSNKAVWLDAGQMVAFPAITDAGDYGLYIARGDGQVRQVTTDLSSLNIAADPDGRSVTYVSKSKAAKPKSFDTEKSKAADIAFQNFVLPKGNDGSYPYKTYKIVWNPDGKQFAYYSENGFYLANSKTGDVCELELGSYGGAKLWTASALAQWNSAQWSPDGRYLALFTTTGETPVPFIYIMIIDMFTGERNILTMAKNGVEYQYAMTWAANSRDVLVVVQNPAEDNRHDLYLLDVATGNTRQILADDIFLFTAYSGISWSSNGKMIALKCPSSDGTDDLKQLCLIDVEIQK